MKKKTSKTDRMRRAMDSRGFDQCYIPAKDSEIICFQENENMKTRGFIREINSQEEDPGLQVDDANDDQNSSMIPIQIFEGEQQHDGDQHFGNTTAFSSSPLRCPTDHRGRLEAGEYRVQRPGHVPGPAKFDHKGKGASELIRFKGRKTPVSRGPCAGMLQNPSTGQPLDQDRPLFPRLVKTDQHTNFPTSARSPRIKNLERKEDAFVGKIDPRIPPHSLWILAQQHADQIVTHGGLRYLLDLRDVAIKIMPNFYDIGEKIADNDWKSDPGLIALKTGVTKTDTGKMRVWILNKDLVLEFNLVAITALDHQNASYCPIVANAARIAEQPHCISYTMLNLPRASVSAAHTSQMRKIIDEVDVTLTVNDDKRYLHLIFSTRGPHLCSQPGGFPAPYSTVQPFRMQPAGYQTQPIRYSRQCDPLIASQLQCLHKSSSTKIDHVRLCLDSSGWKSTFADLKCITV